MPYCRALKPHPVRNSLCRRESKKSLEMAVKHDAAFINRMLDVIEYEVVPKTADGVKVSRRICGLGCSQTPAPNAILKTEIAGRAQEGNKLFGAAVIRKADMSVVAADTNKETEWPLLHGEVSCLR